MLNKEIECHSNAISLRSRSDFHLDQTMVTAARRKATRAYRCKIFAETDEKETRLPCTIFLNSIQSILNYVFALDVFHLEQNKKQIEPIFYSYACLHLSLDILVVGRELAVIHIPIQVKRLNHIITVEQEQMFLIDFQHVPF